MKITSRIFYKSFISIVYLDLVAIKILKISPLDPWQTSDWLINYQGGFIRRGLLGEMILTASKLTGLSAITILIALQLFLYFLFLINTYHLIKDIHLTPLSLALICSPAFLLFPINDPLGGFRKELLIFVLISTLCRYMSNLKTNPPNSVYLYSSLASLFIVMNHEMLVAFLPYVMCPFLVRQKKTPVEIVKISLSKSPVYFVAIAIIFFYRGDSVAIAKICNSLSEIAPKDCQIQDALLGAISILDKDITFAHSLVLTSNPKVTILTYTGSLILGLVPIIMAAKKINQLLNNKEIRDGVLFTICTTFLLTLPLLWVVSDYGRLVYIHLTSLSLLILMILKEYKLKLEFNGNFGWIPSLLYITSWRLIHCNATPETSFVLYELISRIF